VIRCSLDAQWYMLPVRTGFPHTRRSTPRLEEHLASWTKGCEGQKGSGGNDEAQRRSAPQYAPCIEKICSGVLERNTRGGRTDQRKGSPGGLCLRGSLLAVSLIVACYGRLRIGNPVLPADRSLFVGATEVTGVILAISLFTFGSVVRRSYCTCKFIQKETVVPKYRESLRAVSRLMLRLPRIISETRVGGILASRAKRYAVMPYASKNSLFRISPGVGSCSVFIMSPPKLVIIGDRYFCSFTIVEVEADPPLVVDTNGHLSRSAAAWQL